MEEGVAITGGGWAVVILWVSVQPASEAFGQVAVGFSDLTKSF